MCINAYLACHYSILISPNIDSQFTMGVDLSTDTIIPFIPFMNAFRTFLPPKLKTVSTVNTGPYSSYPILM